MMVHVVCNCLNIRVHAKDSLVEPLDLNSDTFSNELLSDPFFQGGVCSVALDLAGITKQLPCLIRTRAVGNEWTIHTCINCHLDVFATHSSLGLDRVLVSQTLKSDPSFLSNLMHSNNYSPLYKIILDYMPDPQTTTNPLTLDLHTRHSEVLEAASSSLQQQLTKYIRMEQESMEERIRNFVAQQREAFNQLQNRARQDKQSIIRLLMESEEEDLQNSITEAMIDSNGLTPPMTPVNITNQISNSPLANSDENMHERLKSEEQDQVVNEIQKPIMRQRPHSFTHPLHGKMSARKKAVINPPRIAQSLDTDGIFDLEGVEEELVSPFYHSDDEGDDELSDSTSDDVFGVPQKDTFRHIPMSLPIDVPLWTYHHQMRNRCREDVAKVPLPDDPAQIAASIKALARSVHQCDTTEMFGDLPRPRLNTMH